MATALPSDAGLSLVEVIVSVFILALATSVIVMAAPEAPDPVDESADRLAQDIARARDAALISGKIMGIDLQKGGYQIVSLRESTWLPTAAPISLSQVRIELLTDQGDDDDDEESDLPELHFDPTGIAKAARIRVWRNSSEVALEVLDNGSVQREGAL